MVEAQRAVGYCQTVDDAQSMLIAQLHQLVLKTPIDALPAIVCYCSAAYRVYLLKAPEAIQVAIA